MRHRQEMDTKVFCIVTFYNVFYNLKQFKSILITRKQEKNHILTLNCDCSGTIDMPTVNTHIDTHCRCVSHQQNEILVQHLLSVSAAVCDLFQLKCVGHFSTQESLVRPVLCFHAA